MAQITAAILNAFATNHRIHGEQARYLIDGAVVIPSLDVIPGKSEAEAIGVDGLVTTIELQDFHVRASDLVLPGGQRFTPDRGHALEVTRSGQVMQFAVNHPNGNQAPYRRADAYGGVLRVHSLQVETPQPVPGPEEEDNE